MLWGLGVALALTAAPAHAQVVRGQVVEAQTQKPIEGAMVILLGHEGAVEHRVLTDAEGGFIAKAVRPGPHSIRVDRIGYESLTTEGFDVPVTGLFRKVEVPVRAVELVGLDVSGSQRCALPKEQGRATAQVWEEARKALQAAAWTLSSGLYRYTLLQFEKDLDDKGHKVTREKRDFVRGTGQAPYVSVPASRLSKIGFIEKNPDGTVTYYAPDANAFLSDEFLAIHCMRVEEIKDGLVGLGFEPLEERTLPDIRGTLWIEAATATLRRLDFTYVNRPDGHDKGDADGQVTFGPLPDGTWVVRDWYVRMPLLEQRRGRDSRFVRLSVRGYQVQGGTLWRVVDRNGATVMEAASATVKGTLLDSLSAEPVQGAQIRMDTDPEARTEAATDVDGAFLVAGLPDGTQDLYVSWPGLDSLGLGPVRVPVEAHVGQVTAPRLRLPGVAEYLGQVCGVPEGEKSTGTTILGRVLRDDAPLAGATVRAMFSGGRPFPVKRTAVPSRNPDTDPTWSLDPDDDRWVTTTLDERGLFVICEVPKGFVVRVEASYQGGEARSRDLTIHPGNEVGIVRIELPSSREEPEADEPEREGR